MTSLFVPVGPSPNQLPPREEGLQPFYEWLRAHNAEFEKVYTLNCVYIYMPVYVHVHIIMHVQL